VWLLAVGANRSVDYSHDGMVSTNPRVLRILTDAWDMVEALLALLEAACPHGQVRFFASMRFAPRRWA